MIFVDLPETSEGKRTALQKDDVLISITADLGIIGVLPENFGETYINQHIALVRIEPHLANSRWVGMYLASSNGQLQFFRYNDSGAKAGMNLPAVGALRIALPKSRLEQELISKIFDAHDASIAVYKQERDKLRLQKQGLMQDLLTGKVRVKV